MDYSPFFIIGLPRSRTAWFSRTFTTLKTHCFHEYSINRGQEEFISNFQAMSNGSMRMGDADSGILMYDPEKIMRAFYLSRFLFVRRDVTEAKNSFERAFKKRAPWEAWNNLGDRLEKWIDVAGKWRGLTVDFSEIHQERVGRAICNWVAPELCFSPMFWRDMNMMKIEVHPETWRENLPESARKRFDALPPC